MLVGEQSRRTRRPAAARVGSPSDPGATAENLRRLASAHQTQEPVRIRYVAADGRPAERELRSVGAESGLVRGTDATTAETVSIPISRVTSVDPAVRTSPLD